jgi:16S rRNA (cytosine967-C5)-methyltransferase
VLVDAPCTALGVLRRHPEIRWRRSPMDPSAASVVQLQILHAASRHVKRGGALVYVVCSPEPEEGSEVVKAFLAESGAFRLDALRTTAPPEHDEDAFFGARLVRA